MRRGILIVVMEFLVLPVLAKSQTNPTDGDQSAHSQQELEIFLKMPASEVVRKYFRKPLYSLLAIRRLIELGDPQVGPDLRRAFAHEEDATRKRFIAAALVSLGDQEEQYFNYVRDAAQIAVHNKLRILSC